MDAKRDAGEWIRPEELRRFITDAFGRRFPASRLEASPEDGDYFHLRLCPAARVSLQNFLEAQDPAGRARGLLNDRTVFLSNPAEAQGTKCRGVELIDAGHLFVRWLRQELDIEGMQPHSVCAARSGSARQAAIRRRALRLLCRPRSKALRASGARAHSGDLRLSHRRWRQACWGRRPAAVRKAAELGAAFTPTARARSRPAPCSGATSRRSGLHPESRANDRAEEFQVENDRLRDQREASARARIAAIGESPNLQVTDATMCAATSVRARICCRRCCRNSACGRKSWR